MAPPVPPKRERRANHQRKAELFAEPHGVLRIVDERRRRNFQPDFAACVLKPQTVFGNFDGAQRRANHFNFVLFEDPAFGELDGEIQSGLPANRGKKRVRPFLDDDSFEIFLRKWLDVGAVRHLRVSHDGGGIRIDENCFVAFVAQGFASLHAGIIKLASLSDDDRPRPDNQNLFNVVPFWHLPALWESSRLNPYRSTACDSDRDAQLFRVSLFIKFKSHNLGPKPRRLEKRDVGSVVKRRFESSGFI